MTYIGAKSVRNYCESELDLLSFSDDPCLSGVFIQGLTYWSLGFSWKKIIPKKKYIDNINCGDNDNQDPDTNQEYDPNKDYDKDQYQDHENNSGCNNISLSNKYLFMIITILCLSDPLLYKHHLY